MGKIAKGANKIHFTMLYGNYCYIFIENFPQKFSPCTLRKIYGIFYYILYFPEGTTVLNICHFIVTNTIYFSQCIYMNNSNSTKSFEHFHKTETRLPIILQKWGMKSSLKALWNLSQIVSRSLVRKQKCILVLCLSYTPYARLEAP